METVFAATSRPEHRLFLFGKPSLHRVTGKLSGLTKAGIGISRLALASILPTAVSAANAQQVAGVVDSAQSPTSAVQPAAPNETIEEKAAITAAKLAAAFTAFKAIMASHSSGTPAASAGKKIATGGNSLTSQDGNGIVGQGAGNVIQQNGGYVIVSTGGSIVAAGGGN